MARRRKRKFDTATVGRDAYRLLGPSGETLSTDGLPQLALSRAYARIVQYVEPVTLTVERDSIIGPRVLLYRLTRDAAGNVAAHTINAED